MRVYERLIIGHGIGVIALWLASGAVLSESVLRVRGNRAPLSPNLPMGTCARWRPVAVTARDGAVLKAWLLTPSNPTGDCVILLHGIKDCRAAMMGLSRIFLDHHYTVLAPDNRGHGDSGGDIVTYGLLEINDLHRWIDLLVSAEHPRNIFALGESLGASILIQSLPSERRLSAVVAECPFANFERAGVYRVAQRLPVPMRIGRLISTPIVSAGFLYSGVVYGLNFGDASPEAAIEKIATPVLLIHGTDDLKTPAADSQVLAARNRQNTQLWLVPGAGHDGAFATAPGEFKERVLQWFSTHARTGVTP